MTQEEFYAFQERNFGGFCKNTILKLRAYALRTQINYQKHSYSLDAYSGYEDLDAAAEDQYQLYGRTFVVRGISLVVRDEIIGECLQFIPPNKRAVLLLSFFGELSDSEIAAFLRISKATVTYRKKDGIRRLRAMMEAMEHEK